MDGKLEPRNFMDAINAKLPAGIRVVSAREDII
jgi:hypothetical protein